MISKKKILALFKKSLHSGWSPQGLTRSVCMGIYIAFSPFPGAHTIMMILFKWLFRLNFPMLFIATSLNNPWTMIPFFSLDYFFGYWLVHHVIGWEPSLTISLEKVFGSGKICVWSFLIGGNVLGIVSALVAYPLMYAVFTKLLAKHTSNFSGPSISSPSSPPSHKNDMAPHEEYIMLLKESSDDRHLHQ